ncbi:MAG: PAS domain-containing protein [Chloroflexi bacterium]|nr:PAS domain-containing protein [Chloroflexota bacterium]MCH7953839.1 PAS domain-containing protein [Chloroflexota bacterium]MCI0813816.1 PAS domain-containing protein [Chloroflexota bacterium]MCI0817021.1 PAS domain-containing protein [Chloroflexota bacterium]MCI0832270.1 PAS domain-containing protein [Chloroflexota bacterium]
MLDSHAVVMADRSGTICVWSAGAERLFGYDAETAIGARLDMIVPHEYRERHWAGFNAAMSGGQTTLDQPAANLSVLRSDGTVVRYPGRLIYLRDAGGRGLGVIGIFTAQEGGDSSLPDM